LSRELRQFRPELLQTFLFHANLVGRIAAWRAGVPRVVCGIRVAERRANLHLRLDRWTQRLVDRYVCVSRGVADFSVSIGRLPPHKIEVIGNGVDVSAFDQARPADLAPFGIPPSGRVVVTVARLDAQKGLVDLVEAASLLAGSIPDLHFLIVGEGAQRSELETLIAHCGLSGRVHLAGHRSDIPQILRAAFAFVLPSRWEGMPNAVLEAMATGLPVIATHVEGTDELVQPGITGLLVSPQSPPQIASALAELTAEPDRAATMGRAGRERAQSEFLWESVVENYERLYRSLLDSPC
jgi:glycosyltransferase involved in cell wall biosynthesis